MLFERIYIGDKESKMRKEGLESKVKLSLYMFCKAVEFKVYLHGENDAMFIIL